MQCEAGVSDAFEHGLSGCFAVFFDTLSFLLFKKDKFYSQIVVTFSFCFPVNLSSVGGGNLEDPHNVIQL